jgi:CheY-like chemotaxis protein
MPKILLVDDDGPFRKMLRITLAQLGYEVREAADGREAMKLLREEPPDLILTDLVMPEKEGLELIGELRLQHPWLKIIAMSGGGRVNAVDYLRVARRLGVDGVLAKPFSSDELRLQLKNVLEPAP